MNQQPEALHWAEWLDDLFDADGEPKAAAAELRRLHAENEVLRKDAERWRFAMNDGAYALCKMVRVGRDFEWAQVTLAKFDAAMKGQS